MMQCKDIPDRPILELLAKKPSEPHGWVKEHPHDVSAAFPEGTPDKLKLAKMGMLIRRGLVSGCACGCRGDFCITGKGFKELGL